MSLPIALLIFIVAASYDLAFAAYVRFAATGRAMHAATASALTYLMGLVGVVAVVKSSLWYALPEVLGLFVGTLIGVLVTRPVD